MVVSIRVTVSLLSIWRIDYCCGLTDIWALDSGFELEALQSLPDARLFREAFSPASLRGVCLVRTNDFDDSLLESLPTSQPQSYLPLRRS